MFSKNYFFHGSGMFVTDAIKCKIFSGLVSLACQVLPETFDLSLKVRDS